MEDGFGARYMPAIVTVVLPFSNHDRTMSVELAGVRQFPPVNTTGTEWKEEM
jgi:hypothetical protein